MLAMHGLTMAIFRVYTPHSVTVMIERAIFVQLECETHDTSVNASNAFQKNLLTAKEMLEYDRKLTETLASSITTLEETKTSILSVS